MVRTPLENPGSCNSNMVSDLAFVASDCDNGLSFIANRPNCKSGCPDVRQQLDDSLRGIPEMRFDTTTLDGIRSEIDHLSGKQDLCRMMGVTPAWGPAANAIIDHLMVVEPDALLRISFEDLNRAAVKAVPDLQQADLMQAAMTLAGGWAYLTDIIAFYRDADGQEYAVPKSALSVAFNTGKGVHPVTGKPEPGFNSTTFIEFQATDKLLGFRKERGDQQPLSVQV